MKNAILSALLAMPAFVGAAAFLTPTDHVRHLDYKLVDEALVIIPVNNQEFSNAAANLYLAHSGFDIGPNYDNVYTLNMPEVVSGGTLDDAVNQGEAQLVSAIENDYATGLFGEGNPLYVFGYSQSDVVMGMAEQQLAAYDNGAINSSDLDFVMVGDSASAYGGFLNSFIDSLPSWLQSYEIAHFDQSGAGEVLGQVTPDEYFPTQVYSLSGDGWANYDGGAHDAGMYSDHLEYLGLTPAEIASAGAPVTEGLTQYFTIQDSMVNSLEALWTQLQIAVSVF
jgi:hypothetical protein